MPFVGVNGERAGCRRDGGDHGRPRHQHRSASRTRPTASSRSARTSQAVAGDPTFNGTVFNFSVDGSATTPAGRCRPLRPAAGRPGRDAHGQGGEPPVRRSSSSPRPRPARPVTTAAARGGNPITVSVPWFNDPTNGGETLVMFTNKVQRVQIKICKLIDPGSVTAIGGLSLQLRRSTTSATGSAERRGQRHRAPAVPGPEQLHRPARRTHPDRERERTRRRPSTSRRSRSTAHGPATHGRQLALGHRGIQVRRSASGGGASRSARASPACVVVDVHERRTAPARSAAAERRRSSQGEGPAAGPRAERGRAVAAGRAWDAGGTRGRYNPCERGQSGELQSCQGERGSEMAGRLIRAPRAAAIRGCGGDLGAALRACGRGLASARSAANGTLEICKAPDNGAAGATLHASPRPRARRR